MCEFDIATLIIPSLFWRGQATGTIIMSKSKRNVKTTAKNPYQVYSAPGAAVSAGLNRKLDEHVTATYVDAYGTFGGLAKEYGVSEVQRLRRAVPDLLAKEWLHMFVILSGNNGALDQHLKESVYYTIEDFGSDKTLILDKCDYDALTVDNLNAIFLIGRKFCLGKNYNVAYLRNVIGDMMNRAPEFVFKDDPKQLELVQT